MIFDRETEIRLENINDYFQCVSLDPLTHCDPSFTSNRERERERERESVCVCMYGRMKSKYHEGINLIPMRPARIDI